MALCLLLLGIPQGLRAQAEGEAETAPRLTKAPRLLRFVEAIYPPERQKAGQEASVLLELRLDASGKVDFAYVLESAGEDFDRAALEAARRFEFEAAEIDGKPAAVSLQYRYQFSLPPPRAEKDVQGALPEAAPAQETPASNIPDEEIVVRAPLEAQEAVSTRIGAEEAGRVPGTQGDAAKVVLNLPGVARPAFASGELVIWGSAPEDSRVYLDGVELPALYHLGGLRSILHSELIDEIQFVPGAYGAEYGRGLGGIVHVHNRDLMVGKKRLRASAAVDLLDASAQLEGSLGRRAALRAAGRYGWIDRIFAGVVDEIGDYVALPRYWDSQVESSWQIGAQERLNFGGLAARDSLARRLPALDPSETRSETLGRSIYRLYARYRRRFGDGAEIGLTPFFGHDAQDRASRFGPLPTEVERQSWQYGLRGFYRAPLAKRLAFEAGADLMGSSSTLSRFGTLTLPNREGDLYVFGQAPGSEVNADRWKAQIVNLAPYATLTWKAGPLTLTPGLRLDSYALAVDRLSPRVGDLPPVGRSDMQWNIEPRLAARVQILQPWALIAGVGLYHQPPRPEDLSAVFGTPTLGLSKGLHTTLGSVWNVRPSLDLELTGFFKTFDNLVTRTQLSNPPLAQSLVQDGVGRSYGLQCLLRQRLWKGLSGWLAYTLSRSERRDAPALDYRLFDYDQTHVLSLVGNYAYARWNFGTRLRWSSGYPRTPVVGAYYDVASDRYQPVFGVQNSIRIPDFVQLDLRIEREFPWTYGKFALYLEALNVTARRNAEEIAYDDRFETKRYITGLPTLGVLGARAEF